MLLEDGAGPAAKHSDRSAYLGRPHSLMWLAVSREARRWEGYEAKGGDVGKRRGNGEERQRYSCHWGRVRSG